MWSEDDQDIARLLATLAEGNLAAGQELMPVIYRELHRLASYHLRHERPDHTLQATALVNEAYLKLVDQRASPATRAHFFSLASQMMRRVLVDYARQRNRLKRGGGDARVELDDALAISEEKSVEILWLDAALDRLAGLDPRHARIVELRYFGGFSVEEVASLLDVSPRTVKRDWTVARAWLHRALSAT